MLSAPGQFGVDFAHVKETAARLAALRAEGFELAVVIGGGNIFRGINLKSAGLSRTPSDQMGMLATLINGIALKAALEEAGVASCLVTALECPRVAESYQYDKVLAAIEKGELIIFVGGTGNPYFTTDTCAALRACEIGADLLVKATKVKGVYDKEPSEAGARRFDTLTGTDYISRQLKVMDMTAVELCMKEEIPIFVMDMGELGLKSLDNLMKNHQGTLIKG